MSLEALGWWYDGCFLGACPACHVSATGFQAAIFSMVWAAAGLGYASHEAVNSLIPCGLEDDFGFGTSRLPVSGLES